MNPSKKVRSEVEINFQTLQQALPNILANLPKEWKGTTYNNSNLLGREVFSQNFLNLVQQKGNSITTEDLSGLGNAQDYLRVSSNISSVLETVLAVQRNRDISTVFSFSSNVMPIFSLLLNSSLPIQFYVGENKQSPLSQDLINLLDQFKCQFSVIQSAPVQNNDAIVLTNLEEFDNQAVDGIILDTVLYINNTQKINPNEVMTIRKRSTTPLTTPQCIGILQKIANIEVTEGQQSPSQQDIDNFLGHLQTMSGTPVNASSYPVPFTAGLAAICSFYLTLIQKGGADIVMASTAYGGSSQLTDVISGRFSSNVNKHTFDITGDNNISKAISDSLDKLASQADKLQPTTVLFIEIPTNPDMKVPVIEDLAKLANTYRQNTKKEVIILVDTTFAPASQILSKIKAVAPELPAMVFISLSKSVSGGFTTAGTIIAGEHQVAQDYLSVVRTTATSLDTTARPDQLLVLSKTHTETEIRCQKAYEIAKQSGEALVAAVKQYCNGYDMHLHFPTPAEASLGFTSSTFSFNLPALKDASLEENQALAQKFVDYLVANPGYKPCVSFGQDNDLVYATVPATSTQGAIKLEDKAKQAVGGVQLVRLSFPTICDIKAIQSSLSESVKKIYQQ